MKMVELPKPSDSSNEEAMESADEALCELLGISSLDIKDESSHGDEGDLATPPKDSVDDLEEIADAYINAISELYDLRAEYESNSVCVFPQELSIPASIMRRLTEELVWSSDNITIDKTYETVRVLTKNKESGETVIEERRKLTRLENFVDSHRGWDILCNNYLRRCVSAALGTPQVLYKEKLNLKPPGGSGFAPHLDTPSLRVALGENGPKDFVTVMVAIDNMTASNGCLRLAKGKWNEGNSCTVVLPEENGSPDASGRAGAIPHEVADALKFEDLECAGGTIAIFNGWVPHRSTANSSPFPRRAVFLTYNSASDGVFHRAYYERMNKLRNDWKERVGLSQGYSADERAELDAMSTIPRI